MKKICKTCLQEFEGKDWMKQSYNYYKNFCGQPRIMKARTAKGVVILSHTSCTKEEVDKWIEQTYGSVHTPENWGAVEITGHNRKVWWNCQNSD